MIVSYDSIVTTELLKGNIDNNEFTGFLEDYRVLHCLLREYNPKSVFEIGTNMGTGTNIICNAVPTAEVYSLDLPTELAHTSLQHPISEGKGDKVGSKCQFIYIQLRGDSLAFDYKQFPCEAAFVDGEHDYLHVRHESQAMVDNKTKLIIFHDSDIPQVMSAIEDTFRRSVYNVYQVIGTRITYALRP